MLQSYHTKRIIEAGIDEAGRGCLAGPVYAAAVILPPDFFHPILNDSKKLNEHDRDLLREVIEREAISYAVGIVDAPRIDVVNILNASFEAMNKAIELLSLCPEALLIDGNRFRTKSKYPYHCIIKGDGIYASIAAASIIAKTYRDEYMKKIHNEHPVYHWHKNKGYPTIVHREAIAENGPCPYHRMSFTLLKEAQLSLQFDINLQETQV